MIFAAFAALLTVGCSNSTENEKETITDTFPQETEPMHGIEFSQYEKLDALYLAFALQESGMDESAVSPCGKYVGCLQISEIMVREANRVLGEKLYTYDDRYDADCSYGMFKAVMEYHNPNLDIEKAINLWNGRAPQSYRDNVKAYFYANLENFSR